MHLNQYAGNGTKSSPELTGKEGKWVECVSRSRALKSVSGVRNVGVVLVLHEILRTHRKKSTNLCRLVKREIQSNDGCGQGLKFPICTWEGAATTDGFQRPQVSMRRKKKCLCNLSDLKLKKKGEVLDEWYYDREGERRILSIGAITTCFKEHSTDIATARCAYHRAE